MHEAINAVAREKLLQAMHIAEREGYTVLHGIVDSMYVKASDTGAAGDDMMSDDAMSDDALLRLAKVVTAETGLVIEYKKRYSFMAFLNSVNADYMPVPTAYFRSWGRTAGSRSEG